MRTLTIILAVLFTISLNVNGKENKLNDPLTTVVIISARHGEDYTVTGHTYKQFAQIKAAIKTINSLKKNKYKYGIEYYNAMFSTVLTGLKEIGITVKKTI